MASPRVLIETAKWRIVEDASGNKLTERNDGTDAMGHTRWNPLKVADADNVGRWFRDFIFEHAAKCPLLYGGVDESQQSK